MITSLEDAGAGLAKGRKSGTYQVMPKLGSSSTAMPEDMPPLYKEEETEVTLGTTELISIAVVSALLVWLLVGLSLVCYRFLIRNSDECIPCEPDPAVAVLYENKDYCEPDTCPKASRKGYIVKIVDCLKNRFHCKTRDQLDEERCLAAISYTSKDTIDVSSSRSYQKRKITKSVSAALSSYRKERVPVRVRNLIKISLTIWMENNCKFI